MNCKDCQWFLVYPAVKTQYPPMTGTCHLTPQSDGWPIVAVNDFCSHFTEKRAAVQRDEKSDE